MSSALELSRRVGAELMRNGAEAVALTGSHARGDATGASDVDLIVIGNGPRYLAEMCDGLLVAQAWSTEAEQRRRLGDPGEVGASVPGWREAVLLHDPHGVAARLKQEALDWTWEALGDRTDAWVADRLVGYVEEAQKLVAALDDGRTLTAAVMRYLLAVRLPPILAVHCRLLYGSENVLWDRVGEAMGAEWQRTQAQALSVGGESFEQSCVAALRLFRLAFDAVASRLDDRQLAVAEHALALVRRYDGGDR